MFRFKRFSSWLRWGLNPNRHISCISKSVPFTFLLVLLVLIFFLYATQNQNTEILNVIILVVRDCMYAKVIELCLFYFIALWVKCICRCVFMFSQWDSIGKGTLVSRGSGIKLVVFINGLDNIDKLVQQRPRLLQHLKTQVGEYKDWGTDVTDVRTTRRSITCTINGCTVDIIPAFNLLKRKISHYLY